jgi:hypothetical protein
VGCDPKWEKAENMAVFAAVSTKMRGAQENLMLCGDFLSCGSA